MSATEMIYKIIDEKCLKQSAVARAAGYDPKKFNALLRGRKKMTSEDVVPICKALGMDARITASMATDTEVNAMLDELFGS